MTALVIPVNVKAASAKSIQGDITEADLDENREHELIGDCTLTMNSDKTIGSIGLGDYSLTINGAGTLRINGVLMCSAAENGALTVDSGNLEVNISGVQAAGLIPAIGAKNITINGGTVRATTDSNASAICAYNHINIDSSLEIIKPSGGKVQNFHDTYTGLDYEGVFDSNNNFAQDVLIAEPDGDHEKKSKHKKVTTASYDCYYTEVDGQIIYGGLIEDVFAPTPASMIPASAYPKFNAFMVKKISGAEAGSTISVNAEPWTSINDKFANAFTEKGDVALTIKYRFKDVLYQVTIPAGTNLTELVDENASIGLARLGSLYGAEPVVETVETEE